MIHESSNMMQDPEVRMLVSIANTLKEKHKHEKREWRDSPFRWMVEGVPPRTKGKIGEELVAAWCAGKGFSVAPSGDSEADLIIEGRRIEIKLSMLWESGIFKFQQLRDQNYEYAICLGISPFDVQCWIMSKELLREHVIDKDATARWGTRKRYVLVLCQAGRPAGVAYRVWRTPQPCLSNHATLVASRWTVSGEKAGRQTATYSAPSGPGVL